MLIRHQLIQYAFLIRLDKPIGILLLLWPTLWALWLASYGEPDPKVLLIFIAGVVLMRSAGCIINDYADRHVDRYVKRTSQRPLSSGAIPALHALSLAALLSLMAFSLVLQCNSLTVMLAFVGILLAILYPFLKRYTHLPQLGLGVAFAWGVPMAFAAQTGTITYRAWVVFLTCMIWPIIYDTLYAMVDREDDLKIGIKSSAILFDRMDRIIIALLQLLFLVLLVVIGLIFDLRIGFYLSLVMVFCFFAYQQWLIKTRDPARCFAAFLNNNWVGLAIFIGILTSY